MRLSLSLAVVLFAFSCAGFGQTPAPAAEEPLVHFQSDLVADPGYDIEVTEEKREGNTSTLLAIHRKGDPRGSLVMGTKAIYQIAKARHAAYFITLKEKMRPDGNWSLVVGFPDNDHPNVETDFPVPYSKKNLSGKTRVCFSVAECAVLFEPKAEPKAADAPAATAEAVPSR
ncbi:hypothetical protein SAMN05444156_0696 [Verrucomicrobium sp. GAS474]|uniref:hypothetical protein n=1 Tax=Verrucomicrobium sp. GAS474 TaxID=1882831 RepID=UPI00087BDD14|nr:hypothetical protein [Verrucomicrobium sp. GAS474]SDT91461.1 hypothetical protein SAMN05444156_0696 [Verrucomicrobium sp. GAS474]